MPAGTVSRRYIPGFAVTAVAAVVGFFVARNSSAAEPEQQPSGPSGGGDAASGGQRLAGVNDVPPGGGLIIADQDVVLTRDTAGGVAAFSATCTHQGCTVASVEGGTINCTCHGSKFDAQTGAPVDGPAKRPLPEVGVEVRGDAIYTA